jgi:hypothetical protein
MGETPSLNALAEAVEEDVNHGRGVEREQLAQQ